METLEVTRSGGIVTVTMNRPHRKNAANGTMWQELLTTFPELATLGLDPVESVVSWETFGRALLRRPVALRSLLMDATFLVGVGPVYADEILPIVAAHRTANV